MLIKALNIHSFGKLKNIKIDFINGFNIIYGLNESGKSTITSFIKAILYGMADKKNKTKDRVMYMPWDGNIISGSMHVQDGDRDLLIHRKIDKKDYKKDEILITENISGKNIYIDGIELTGLTPESFENTVFIRQLSSPNISDDINIKNRLLNITNSENEDTNAINALKDIEKQIDDLTGKKTGISIYSLERQRDDIIYKIRLAETKQKEMLDVMTEIKDLKIKLKNINDEISELLRIKPLYQKATEIKAHIRTVKEELEVYKSKAGNDDLIEKRKQLQFLNNQYEVYSKKSINNKAIFYKLTGIIISVISFILAITVGIRWLFLLIPSSLIFFIYNKNKKYDIEVKYKLQLIKKQIDESKKQIDKIEENDKIYKSIINDRMELLKKLNDELEAIKNKIDLNLDIEEVLDNDYNIKSEIMLDIANKENGNSDNVDSILELEEQLEELDETIKQKRMHLEALELAHKTLKECIDNVRVEFAPKFVNRVNYIVGELTNGKIKVGVDELDVSVYDDSIQSYRDIKSYSKGTIDQIYLSFRIALGEFITEKKVPLILDDALVQYDDYRIKNALKFLYDYSKDRQVILLTCQSREIDILKNLNSNINIIEIT